MKISRWVFALAVGIPLSIWGARAYNDAQYAQWQEDIYHGEQASSLTMAERREVMEISATHTKKIFWIAVGSIVTTGTVLALLNLVFGEKWE